MKEFQTKISFFTKTRGYLCFLNVVIQGVSFQSINAIISENVRRSKNIWNASFFCFERAVIWYYFGDTKVTAIFSSIIAICVNQNRISFSQKFKVVINFLNGVVYF